MSIIYNTEKYQYFPGTLKAYMENKLVAPTHIRIKPINLCNHNCWYCAYRNDSLQLGDSIELKDAIPEEKMREIISDIIDMGVKAVTFSGGGEPLIYKSLPEHIEKLSQAGVKVAALSNGSNLKGKMAEAFSRYGTWIRISIDAWDDDSYTKARGVPDGSFTRLLDNMKAFIDSGTECVLGVSFIIGRENYEHIYEACSRFKEIGVNHVKLSGVVVGNSVKEINDYHETISDAVAKQIKKSETLNDSKFNAVNHYHQLEDRFIKGYNSCPYLMYLTIIGADSCVYTCQDKAYTNSGLLGSLNDKSFKEFWFSEENNKRIFSFNPSIECQHHCVTHLKNLSILDFVNEMNEHTYFV